MFVLVIQLPVVKFTQLHTYTNQLSSYDRINPYEIL